MFKIISSLININQSISSGYNDIIAVRNEEGIKMTNFRVRFGTEQILKPEGKKIFIEINQKRIPTKMKLRKNGDAFFMYDIRDSNIINSNNINIECPIIISNSYKEIVSILNDENINLEDDDNLTDILIMETFIQNIINDLNINIYNDNLVCLFNYELYSVTHIENFDNNFYNFTSTITFENFIRQKGDDLIYSFYNKSIINFILELKENNYNTLSKEKIINKLKDNFEEYKILNKNKKKSKYLLPPKYIIQSLNLNLGKNEIKFYLERSNKKIFLTGYIYLYNHDTNFIISDVDGTVTKSDAIGMILNSIGKDYSHQGIAKLYTNIEKNGYKFIYVSSRTICQNSMTRDYISKINQDGYTMPDGPLILSPNGYFTSLKREVVEKDTKTLKIDILLSIKRLFYNRNPFVCGFGNRINDAIAYRTLGIQMGNIFIINKRSELVQLNSKEKKTYDYLNNKLDELFPKVI